MNKAKLIKYGLTGLGLLCTGIGSVLNDKVKADTQKETIAKLVKEELTKQAQES